MPKPYDPQSGHQFPATRIARRCWATAALVILAVLSVALLKRTSWVKSAPAPEYRMKGPENAPVTLIEFSDFQCPSCKHAQPVLESIEKQFSDKVRVVFKQMPLRMHTWALDAAKSAECAGLQGKFWVYHDILFEEQKIWGESKNASQLFTSYASRAGLDIQKFETCIDSAIVDQKIQKDLIEAEAKEVRSTPTFFIGEKRFVGSQQLSTLGMDFIRKAVSR